MAGTAYLRKTSGELSEELFTANNTIPLFWFNLLDLNLIQNNEEDLLKYDYNEDYEDDEYVVIKLPKNVFMANLNSGKIFIEKHYPDKINLYNDFINYFDTKFHVNDIMELDILEISGFFDEIEDFIREIKNILVNIERNINDLTPFAPGKNIFLFTGYSVLSGNAFVHYSQEYSDYWQNEQNENKKKLKEADRKKRVPAIKAKANGIFLCLGGIAFMGGGVYGLIKTEDYFMGIGSILFGAVIMFTGILHLRK